VNNNKTSGSMKGGRFLGPLNNRFAGEVLRSITGGGSSSDVFLTSALDGGEGSASRPRKWSSSLFNL
jgi:hypothetical protein